MKSLLPTLTAIGISVTAISSAPIISNANQILNTNNKKEAYNSYLLESNDNIKYDLSNKNQKQTFKLDDLVVLLNQLNKIHKENNINIRLYGLPRWWLFDSTNSMIFVNIINDLNTFATISNIINSDDIIFSEANFEVVSNSKITEINMNIKYKISGIVNSLNLVNIKRENVPTLPLQESMKLIFHIGYEY